ncbi:MAG: hypothetical protein Q7U20_05915 [Caulobacter sp.]|nr:hypothetical protein [Caulobacter sp.]
MSARFDIAEALNASLTGLVMASACAALMPMMTKIITDPPGPERPRVF